MRTGVAAPRSPAGSACVWVAASGGIACWLGDSGVELGLVADPGIVVLDVEGILAWRSRSEVIEADGVDRYVAGVLLSDGGRR